MRGSLWTKPAASPGRSRCPAAWGAASTAASDGGHCVSRFCARPGGAAGGAPGSVTRCTTSSGWRTAAPRSTRTTSSPSAGSATLTNICILTSVGIGASGGDWCGRYYGGQHEWNQRRKPPPSRREAREVGRGTHGVGPLKPVGSRAGNSEEGAGTQHVGGAVDDRAPRRPGGSRRRRRAADSQVAPCERCSAAQVRPHTAGKRPRGVVYMVEKIACLGGAAEALRYLRGEM